jgi:hypothetical protein
MPARVPCRCNPPRGYWGTGGAAELPNSQRRRRYSEIENAIDNLDNLEEVERNLIILKR